MTTLPPDIQVIAGPSIVGSLCNWGLYGALVVQVYLYYMSFPKDHPVLKCLIFGVFAVETAQTILVARDAFTIYAKGFGNLNGLESVELTWLSVPIMCGIVSCTVQLVFAYRIFKLSGSKIAGLCIAIISGAQFTAAMIQGVQSAILGNFQALSRKAIISCTVWLAATALCDLIIALTVTYYLTRADTAFKATEVLINRLVRLTIETGSLTAAFAIIDLALFLGLPNNSYFNAVSLPLTKLYSNNLLLIYNSRIRIVGGRENVNPTVITSLRDTTNLVSTGLGSTFGSNRTRSLAVNVSMDMMNDPSLEQNDLEMDKFGHLSSHRERIPPASSEWR